MPSVNEELSERELEILSLLATGASNKEIASQLSISTNTVKVHVRNIFAKIGAGTRTEAVMYAIKAGLVSGVAVADEPGTISTGDGGAGMAAASGAVGATAEALASEGTSRTVGRRWLILGAAALGVLLVAGLAWWWMQPSRATVPVASGDATRWQSRSALPTPRFGLAAIAYESFIYAIGGQSSQGASGAVERYDPATDAWKSLSAKPTPVYEILAATVGGEIYVPGGRLSADQVTNVLEIYDPLQDRWRQGASLPTGLSAYAIATFEGKLYVFGGWDGTQIVSTLYQYEPARDAWTPVDELPSPRAYAGAAAVGGKIYVMGGYTGRRSLADNLVYQPAHPNAPSSWSEAQALPSGRHGMGVTSIAEIVEVVGGVEEESSELPLSLSYFPFNNSWQEFGVLENQNPLYPGVATLGNYLYVIGGQVNGQPSGQHLAYQAIYTISFPIIR